MPHSDGGRVVVMADAAEPVVQALVRWDPAGHAAAELAGRAEVGFPPAVRMAAVEGSAAAVAEVLAELGIGPAGWTSAGGGRTGRGGPLPGWRCWVRSSWSRRRRRSPGQPAGRPRERALLRVPRAEGRALAAALHAAQAARTARKAPDPVRIRLDPVEIG